MFYVLEKKSESHQTFVVLYVPCFKVLCLLLPLVKLWDAVEGQCLFALGNLPNTHTHTADVKDNYFQRFHTQNPRSRSALRPCISPVLWLSMSNITILMSMPGLSEYFLIQRTVSQCWPPNPCQWIKHEFLDEFNVKKPPLRCMLREKWPTAKCKFNPLRNLWHCWRLDNPREHITRQIYCSLCRSVVVLADHYFSNIGYCVLYFKRISLTLFSLLQHIVTPQQHINARYLGIL